MSVLPSAKSQQQQQLTGGASVMDKLRRTSSGNALNLLPGMVNTSGLTIQSSSTPVANKSKNSQQPSISITPLPRAASSSALANKPSLSVSPVTPAAANAPSAAAASINSGSNSPLTVKAGQPGMPGQKGAVVCEICDGSIKVILCFLSNLKRNKIWNGVFLS